MQAYQRLQIQQQMLQAQRNVSGPIRQQEQQVLLHSGLSSFLIFPVLCHSGSALDYFECPFVHGYYHINVASFA